MLTTDIFRALKTGCAPGGLTMARRFWFIALRSHVSRNTVLELVNKPEIVILASEVGQKPERVMQAL